jgi:hypothetical protein
LGQPPAHTPLLAVDSWDEKQCPHRSHGFRWNFGLSRGGNLMSKRLDLAAIVIALTVAAPNSYAGGGGSGLCGLATSRVKTSVTEVSTPDVAGFTAIPKTETLFEIPGTFNRCVLVRFSVILSIPPGSSVKMRALIGSRIIHPGEVVFAGNTGNSTSTQTYSFEWFRNNTPPGIAKVRMEWDGVGDAVTLKASTLVIQY